MYKLQATAGKARLGTLRLPHATMQTPVFMPIATQGALKGPLLREAQTAKAKLLLANTFHLFLRPGLSELANYGGLHKFMGWEQALLTDSGGFQLFSLRSRCSVSEEGATFSSPYDGAKFFLSPEIATQAQQIIGADIMMCLDECLAYPASLKQARDSLNLSLRWAKRCKLFQQEQTPTTAKVQELFGIVQGGVYPQLRRECIAELLALDFDGYALGGLAVGESQAEMLEMVEHCTDLLPVNKPRYLMGVGTPVDLVEAVARGIDMFDCVLPTRNARNGQLFTKHGVLRLRNAKLRGLERPPQEDCGCYCCRNYSLGYLHHLFRCGEMSGAQLAATHNIFYYQELMRQLQEAIKQQRFREFYAEFKMSYNNSSKIS